MLRKLKTGGFGSVYIGRGIGQDSTRYAIKLMPKKYERYANVEYEIYELIKNKKFTLGFIKVAHHLLLAIRLWCRRVGDIPSDGADRL